MQPTKTLRTFLVISGLISEIRAPGGALVVLTIGSACAVALVRSMRGTSNAVRSTARTGEVA